MGGRADLASPETDLTTHVDDVVRLLEQEDLQDVVLVGHSYGALVTTGAADRVPERVARLVYVDTGPLPNGMAQADFEGPRGPGGLLAGGAGARYRGVTRERKMRGGAAPSSVPSR